MFWVSQDDRTPNKYGKEKKKKKKKKKNSERNISLKCVIPKADSFIDVP